VTSPQKRKGDAFERAAVEVFRANGHPHCERLLGAGRRADCGDLAGVRGNVVVEVKDRQRLELAAWVDETERERIAAQAEYGLLIVKRRNRSAGEAYAIMPLGQMARLLAELDT
jgi:hypothetical protein